MSIPLPFLIIPLSPSKAVNLCAFPTMHWSFMTFIASYESKCMQSMQNWQRRGLVCHQLSTAAQASDPRWLSCSATFKSCKTVTFGRILECSCNAAWKTLLMPPSLNCFALQNYGPNIALEMIRRMLAFCWIAEVLSVNNLASCPKQSQHFMIARVSQYRGLL